MQADVWKYTLDAMDTFLMYRNYARHTQKSLEDLEKQLLELKKESDENTDYEQLAHEAYCIQNLIFCCERDLKLTKAQIEAISSSDLGDSTDRAVTEVVMRGRQKSYEGDLIELRERYQKVILELKEKRFSIARRKIDEEIAEVKAELAEANKPEVEDKSSTDSP